ncbi:Hypothetical protein KVN_LOCUS92 [uncultured virus]|nr:Hypothetical protein KVN_LOCUS92 [uncultured virus]
MSNNNCKTSTRLNKDDGYIRPKMTFTDKLTEEDINNMLEDYKKIDDIGLIQIGTHVRYIIIDENNNKKFRTGGNLINLSKYPLYVILGNGNKTWSVQVDTAVFYRKLSIEEIKKEYEGEIEELENEIIAQKKTINNLKNYIIELKENVNNLKTIIKKK